MPSPIGLIAGEGKFPVLFAQNAKNRGLDLVVVALKNEMNEDLSAYSQKIHWVSVSKLGGIIDALKSEGVQKAVMAGRVKHTRIFADLVPDFRAAQLFFKLKDRRADSILGGVADELAKDGIELLPSTTFLEHLLPAPGLLTKRKLKDTEMENVKFGVKMAQGLAALDIGQTVVVRRKTVVAVEAMEGTDECIRRAASYVGKNVVIVKTAKPKQDLRFDVPIMGMTTLKVMKEVDSHVLAIESGKTLMLEMDQCLEFANKNDISIYAWGPTDLEV